MADDSLDYDSYLQALQDQQAQAGLLGPSDYSGFSPQAAASQSPQMQMPADLQVATPSITDAGATGSVPSAASGLPDPNQLYAAGKAAGVPSDYTKFAPGVTTQGMDPKAAALANYVDKNYPNLEIAGTNRTGDSNAAVGGAKHSQHLEGKAFDIHPLAPMSTDQKVQFIQDMQAQGARGLGIYPTGSLHVDARNGPPAIWGSDYHYGSFASQQPAAVVQAGQNFRQGVLNQANPIPTTQAGNTGSVGTPAGPAAAVGAVQGPNLPGDNPGNVDQAGRIPDPSRPATPAATAAAGNGQAGQGGPAKKGDTNEDKMQKLAKAIMGFGALGAKGPLHYAPPASGGSPVNRPDVAQPEVYKGAARILPKINFRGLLG